MHHLYTERKMLSDSMYMPLFEEIRYFNRDTLFSRYAERGFLQVSDELTYYYDDVLTHMPWAERKEEGEKAIAIIRKLGNKAVFREIGFIEGFILPDSTDVQFDRKVEALHDVATKAFKQKDPEMGMRILSLLFQWRYYKQQYSEAFSITYELSQRLEDISETEYPQKKEAFFVLGDIYYKFHNYDRAIPYLKMAVKDSAVYFYDRSNLRARNTLGVYYRNLGDLDTADAWFRSMLESPDMVKYRPMYDCIAISNLAGNLDQRGQHRQALDLWQLVLPVAVGDKDYSFAAGIVLGMGECYLALKESRQVEEMIDTARVFISLLNEAEGLPRKHSLNLLLSKYYAEKGDARLSQMYIDSTQVTGRRLEEQFNALHILRAEQDMFEAEKRQQEEALQRQRIIICSTVIISVVLLVLLLIILRLYRKKQEAYRQLVIRSREWAENFRILPSKEDEADEEDILIMEAISRLIEEEEIYRDPELTLESLAHKIGHKRNSVSKAINNTQGKMFNAFINEYRIRETIRMMSDPAGDRLTLDAIGFDAGFNSRATFYRVFRNQTGLSPLHFRKNRDKAIS